MLSITQLIPVLLLAAAAPGIAQENSLAENPNPPSESAQRVEQIALALDLAEYARTSDDAEAMLLAAQIVGPLLVSDSEGDPDAAKAAKVDRDSLLDEAEKLAIDDDDMLDRITTMRAAASKGCVGGCDSPISLRRWLPISTAWTVKFDRRGGEPFLVAAQREADTAVDMKVYDENDNLVCEDLSHKVVLRCRVDPQWTGSYRVKLINHGTIGTGIQIVTN